MHVDPQSALLKYYQLSEILRQTIDNKKQHPPHPNPTEREVETCCNVRYIAVREAFNHVADQEYMYGERERETFLLQPTRQPMLHTLPIRFTSIKYQSPYKANHCFRFSVVNRAI
jgi:DNA-binding GntR family transcriptional regulator